MPSPGKSPLRILITRAPDQAEGLASALRALGHLTEEAAAIRTEPVAFELGEVPPDAWLVFTSANGVRAMASWPVARLAAVGPATAEALRQAVRFPDLVAQQQDGAGLARALIEAGGRLAVLPRGELATPELPARLAAAGWEVRQVVAYRTVPVPIELAGPFDWVVFASGSAFSSVLAQRPDLLAARIASIGPRTSEVVRAAGYEVAAEAATPTPEGLAAAIAGS